MPSDLNRRYILVCGLSALTACGGGGTDEPKPTISVADWEIGPIINGDNFSRGLPIHPTKTSDSLVIDLPTPAQQPHYVTLPVGGLTGKSKIVLTYHIELSAGADIVPVGTLDVPALVTLYLQRDGDDWSGVGEYAFYRWYASFASQRLIEGDHIIEASFDQKWTSVFGQSNPEGFRAALSNASRVGFVLGNSSGLGHGVYATAPARIVVTSFEVK